MTPGVLQRLIDFTIDTGVEQLTGKGPGRIPDQVPLDLDTTDDPMRVVGKLRQTRQDVKIHVRADAGFGLPVMMGCCKKQGLSYTFGLRTNAVLRPFATSTPP